MRVALVNPAWTFEGSIYFGCREPHLPLELGYARALLAARGHEAEIFDAHLFALSDAELYARVARFAPDVLAVTTAPSYLFWRCAPPELAVPRRALALLAGLARHAVAVGPHPSTTPRAAVRKLGVDAAVVGECEQVLVDLCDAGPGGWAGLPSVATPDGRGGVRVNGPKAAADVAALPALAWGEEYLARHAHQHHRFDRPPAGPGAELEATRGCPYSCTFCAKDNFRNKFRRRPLAAVTAELDALVARGVEYVYLIDEIFLPDRALLAALRQRPIAFGVQMRIDLWTEETLDLLGEAGCVSIEAGVESITPEGRSLLAKKCRLSTDDLTRLLVRAKRHVPFVQANLINGRTDDPAEVRAWRDRLRAEGVWANDPVPMFPYPGSPDYTLRWGEPDDLAWERAHEHYLREHGAFSDIQETRPRPLEELEAARV